MPDLWLTRCRGLEPLTRNVDPTGIVVRSVAPLLQLPGGRFAVQKRRELPRAVWAATTLLGIMPPAMLAASRVGAGHASRRVWARTATRLLSIDLHLSGVEHIDPAQHYVVVPLHEGFADIPALLHLPLDLTFAVRSQLLEWRVFGRHLRTTRQVSVDLETPVASYRRLLRAVPAIFGPRGKPRGLSTGCHPRHRDGIFARRVPPGREIRCSDPAGSPHELSPGVGAPILPAGEVRPTYRARGVGPDPGRRRRREHDASRDADEAACTARRGASSTLRAGARRLVG